MKLNYEPSSHKQNGPLFEIKNDQISIYFLFYETNEPFSYLFKNYKGYVFICLFLKMVLFTFIEFSIKTQEP